MGSGSNRSSSVSEGDLNDPISLSQVFGAKLSLIEDREQIQSSFSTAKKWKTKGYNPFEPDTNGYTALHRAASKGDCGITRSLLVSYGGNPMEFIMKPTTDHQQTAIHIAARKAHLDVVNALTSYDLPLRWIDRVDQYGNTVLHYAVSARQMQAENIVSRFLAANADVHATNAKGLSPLAVHVMTTQIYSPKITLLLLRHGADVNTTAADQATVLHVAVSRCLWEIAGALVQHGANMNLPNDDNVMVSEMMSDTDFNRLCSYINEPPTWVSFTHRKVCMICRRNFSLFKRRHHCRMCGRICCGPCSPFKKPLLIFEKHYGAKTAKKKQRVCRTCFHIGSSRRPTGRKPQRPTMAA